MKARYIGIVCWMIGFLMVSCSEQEILPSVNEWESVRIYVTANNGNDVNQTATRLAYTDSSVDGKGVSVTWSSGDSFYLKGSMETLDESGNPVVSHGQMDIMEQEDEYTAIETFTGIINGKSLIDSEKVTAYYPAAAYDADNNCFKVDVRTTTQTSDNEMAHLSATNYMIGTGSVMGEAVSVSFSGGNKVAIIRFDMKIPAQSEAVGIEKFQILSEDLHTIGRLTADEASVFMEDMDRENHRQTIFLEGYTAGTSETELKVYATVLPTELKGTMTLRAILANGNVYAAEVTFSGEKNVLACNRYYILQNMTKLVELEYDWYTNNGSSTTYTISNEGELFAFANIVNGTAPSISRDNFSGKTVILANDIELNSDWMPIGVTYGNGNSYTFNGKFEGQKHRVNCIYIDQKQIYGHAGYGFFGNVKDAIIRNLTVEGKEFIKPSCPDSYSSYVGGLIGKGDDVIIENCRNEIDILVDEGSNSGLSLGGLAGEVGTIRLLNCQNSGDLINLNTSSYGQDMGGIVGDGGSGIITLIACVNEAAVLKNADLDGGTMGGLIGSTPVKAHNLVACYSLVKDFSPVSRGTGLVFRLAKGSSNGKANVYGCYAMKYDTAASLFNMVSLSTGSCGYLFLDDADKNSKDKMNELNEAIHKWNSTLSSTDDNYCHYHFEQGTSHLVLVETNNDNSGTLENMGNGGEIGKE